MLLILFKGVFDIFILYVALRVFNYFRQDTIYDIVFQKLNVFELQSKFDVIRLLFACKLFK